jgi:hypothetical protein
MNFVTPRQRQQWLGQAEDYADVVRDTTIHIDTQTYTLHVKCLLNIFSFVSR